MEDGGGGGGDEDVGGDTYLCNCDDVLHDHDQQYRESIIYTSDRFNFIHMMIVQT